MKKNRLSHSAASMYQTCGKKYEYHYIKKLRSRTTTGALLFGSAVDAGIGAMINGKGKNPEKVFNYLWNFADINGTKTYLPTCTEIVYSDSDADIDLLRQEDLDKLVSVYNADWKDKLDKILEKKDKVGFKFLDKSEKTLLNHYNWLCLKVKGLLMLKAFKEKVMPKIIEVLGVQTYVKLENSNGDSIIGYVDLICRYEGFEKPVVFDIKTSSIEYKPDSVLTSPQLTLYVHSLSEKFENTRNAGFIVLQKRINKNKTKFCSKCGHNGTGQRHKTCDQIIKLNELVDKPSRCNGAWIESFDPEVMVNIITDEIPVQTENIVLQNFDDINEALKTDTFTRNFNSCVMPWGKCQYFDKCYKDSNDGLVDLSKPNE